jgi:uncharacterized protein YwgA
MNQVLEAEKLLLMVYEAKKAHIILDREKVNPYVYLMRNRYQIPLFYVFRFNPAPYSDELEDDLESLKKAGHVHYSSPVVITDRGIERIEGKINELRSLSENIVEALEEMSNWDDKMLFQAIYDAITG